VKKSILVALSDSMISRKVIDVLISLKPWGEQAEITLLHIFRKPSAEVELMGRKFAAEQRPRIMAALESARTKLLQNGYTHDQVVIDLVTDDYETVTEGIIDRFRQQNFAMVFIGRKKMSKSEEFVLGDIAIKLVRALEGTAVVVVKDK